MSQKISKARGNARTFLSGRNPKNTRKLKLGEVHRSIGAIWPECRVGKFM